MARPLRIQAAGLSYHVTGRGNAGTNIYVDDDDRLRFLETLEDVLDDARVDCHAYCLMATHYHLVITTREANISAAFKQLNGCYAQSWNSRHRRTGHVFQGRFGARVVQDGEYLLRACRYTVLNAVRARIVHFPEQWPWSSYRATAGMAPVPPFLRCEVLWQAVGGDDLDAQMQHYRDFVAKPDAEAGELLRKLVFGDEQFVTGFQQWRDAASREVPRRERKLLPDLTTLFSAAITRRDRCAAVFVALRAGYRTTELARYLNVSRGTVRRMAARAAQANDCPF